MVSECCNGKKRLTGSGACALITQISIRLAQRTPILCPTLTRLVDGASGYRILSFLDAYSGYNQIRMYPPDEEKTAFMTEGANFCYRVMPFGLKNVGATYQRLMDKVFIDQIGKNLEVYVDDMVMKSDDPEQHPTDLEDIFSQLGKHNMRLNPEKCSFGVQGG